MNYSQSPSLGVCSAAMLALVWIAGASPASARGPDLPIELSGGRLKVESLTVGYDERNPVEGEDRVKRDISSSVFLDFDFNAYGFAGDFTVNGIHKFGDSAFKFRYGDKVNDGTRNKAELYSFQASRLGDSADVHVFHHVPRYHWGYEGDFFGLLKEATDIEEIDEFGGEAPSGIEIVGKGALDGFKAVAGKEIYWGADKLAMAKYQFGPSDQYAVVAQSGIGDHPAGKKLSVQGDFALGSSTVLKAGVLSSGTDKLGDEYLYAKDGVVYSESISTMDTLAFKARLEEELGSATMFTEVNYAGLVAEGGEHQEIWDTNLPHSEAGNRRSVEVGARIQMGSLMLSPRVLVRRNIVDPMSTDVQDVSEDYKRHVNNSVFSVGGNRKADAAELYFTYDPTPGTFFYEWDNYLKEDADFAFNLGVTKIKYLGKADSSWFPNGDPVAYADSGRPEEELIRYSSRLVVNPSDSIKITADIEAGHQQPVDSEFGLSRFTSFESTLVHNSRNIFTVSYANDAYGEYDYYRDYGTSYPRQISAGYERLVGDLAAPSRVGIKGYKRNLNAASAPGGEYSDGTADNAYSDGSFTNRYMYEIQLYYVYAF